MAKKKKTTSRDAGDLLQPCGAARSSGEDLLRTAMATGSSGRYIVLFRPGASAAGTRTLASRAGVTGVASTADSESGALDATLLATENVLFDQLDMAVVDMEPDQVMGVASAPDYGGIELIVPETAKYAAVLGGVPAWPAPALPVGGLPAGAWSQEYLRGYLDGVARLVMGAGLPLAYAEAARGPLPDAPQAGPFGPGPAQQAPAVTADAGGFDEARLGHTWGLEVTKVVGSDYSGQGVKVAVLDTGFDLAHPDFAGRKIEAESFVPGPGGTAQPAQDGNGHGTHCVGTACGPRDPGISPRYGVAFEAEVYVGKVLNDAGSGLDSWILAGINWAVRQGCRVISLSLSGPPTPSFVAYERAAKVALRTAAVIAAAGNDSRRHLGIIRPVGTPANCASVFGVGAVDAKLQVADFSNRGTIGGGGTINAAGPGVDVYSSWPMPLRYKRLSGTSMATPHVAGIAALVAQAKPNYSGSDILNALTHLARQAELAPGLSEQDAGAGLIAAP